MRVAQQVGVQPLQQLNSWRMMRSVRLTLCVGQSVFGKRHGTDSRCRRLPTPACVYVNRLGWSPAQWSVTARPVVPSRLNSNRTCIRRRLGESLGAKVHFLADSVASR